MKSFLTFVQETFLSRPVSDLEESKIRKNGGFLFHLTTEKSLINILKHEYFRPSSGCIGVSGLSTTFDPNYNWGGGKVKFVLNYRAIKKDYELMFIDEQLGVDESEIKIVSDKAITPIRKYIVDIQYKGNDSKIQNLIDDYLKEVKK